MAGTETKTTSPVARSVTLVTAMLEAGSDSSAAKEAPICATTAGDATAAAGSSAPPDGAMEKESVSCALTEPHPCAEAGWPTAHCVHELAPGPEKKPSGHGWHDTAPRAAAKEPAAHGRHAFEVLAPACAE